MYILEGGFIQEKLVFTKGMYARRPPEMKRSLCKTAGDRLTFEVRYCR